MKESALDAKCSISAHALPAILDIIFPIALVLNVLMDVLTVLVLLSASSAIQVLFLL